MLQVTLDKIKEIEEEKFFNPSGNDPVKAKIEEYGTRILDTQTKHHELDIQYKAILQSEARMKKKRMASPEVDLEL